MNPTQAVYMVETCLATELKYAQDQFLDRPSSDNWTKLLPLMAAWQHWKMNLDLSSRTKLAVELDPLPISQWSAKVALLSGI